MITLDRRLYTEPAAPLYNEAVTYRGAPLDGVAAGAIFNEEYEQAIHRYALWRIWNPDKKYLVVIGLNPSKATHLVLDPTVRRDLSYARDWGYGGLIKLNLFSYRATDPREMIKATRDGIDITGGSINDKYIEWFCEHAGMILCAWGTHGSLLNRDGSVLSLLLNNSFKLHVLGLTRDGQPRHTLYLRRDAVPERWYPPKFYSPEGDPIESVR